MSRPDGERIMMSRPAARLGWALALLAVALTPGCGGCRRDGRQGQAQKQGEGGEQESQAKEKDKDQLKPKPNFEFGALRVEPAEGGLKINYVKSGHWVAAQQAMRANNFDFPGEIHSRAVDASGRPFTLEATAFEFQTERPVALTQGQTRLVDTLFHVPWFSETRRNILFSSELRQRRGGAVNTGASGALAMAAHEFFLLVLADPPEQYTYVKLLSSIDPPGTAPDNSELRHYRVAIPKIAQRIPAPAHPLAWTMVAYVLWDRADATLMTGAQRDAMLDWLHWGGQLIISGPGNLDQLRSSFLGPHLPADYEQAVELGPEELEALNAEWSLNSVKKRARMTINVLEDAKLPGIRLRLREGAAFVPGTGELVVERRVGRGRVVATAFPLGDRRIRNWGSIDSFYNGVLLRRPARRFSSDSLQYPVAQWDGLPPQMMLEPRLNSTVRYLTRDLPDRGAAPAPPDRTTVQSDAGRDDPRFRGCASWRDAGVAAWNPRSGAAFAARRALKHAAGIKVPKASFVLRAVTLYLLALVPLNWLFFRLLGRVEWAWVAAPVIAIVGAVGVVRMAQLDIGFARSVTEAAVLELHAGHERGHLTRYTALYTSLSTSYEMEMEDSSSLAEPFSANLGFRLRVHDRVNTAALRRERGAQLKDFQVASNSTGALHSEQMLPLGGAVSLNASQPGRIAVSNHTSLPIQDAGVLWRRPDGTLSAAWIGDLTQGVEHTLEFSAVDSPWLPQWEQVPEMSTQPAAAGELSLSEFAKLAAESLELGPDELRLIGWVEGRLAGADVQPGSAQQRAATLVIVHLRQERLPACQRDVNLLIDFAGEASEAITELPEESPEGMPVEAPDEVSKAADSALPTP